MKIYRSWHQFSCVVIFIDLTTLHYVYLRCLLCDAFKDVRYVIARVNGEFKTHPYLSLESQVTVGV